MNFTRKQIYGIFKSLKPSQFKQPEVNQVVTHFATLMKVEECESLKKKLKELLKDFKRDQSSNQKQSSNARSMNTDEVYLIKSEQFTPLVDSGSDKENEEPVEPVIKKRKSFQDLSNKMKANRTTELLEYLKNFVNQDNSNSIGSDVTINQMLGYLLHRLNHQNDKKVAAMGQALFHQEESYWRNGKSQFDLSEAIALMHELTLTKEQMRTMKSYLSTKGVVFPNTNQLLEARKNLRPVIRSELNDDGVSVDYVSLVEMTSKSLINIINKDEIKLDPLKPVSIIYKDGGDGAGSQTVWKSKSMENAADHLFQYSIVPLRVEQDREIKRKNPTPNSASCTRPVYLLRAEETEERVLDLVIPTTDSARDHLESSISSISDSKGNSYDVCHTIKDTMKDLKFKKKLSGLGGADCIICESRKKDWMNVDKIKEGFPITRLAENSIDLYNDLVQEGGEILRSAGDYDTRKGLTQKPLTTSDQHSICILHSYLNVLKWFLKLLYRCNQTFESWIEKQTILGEPIRVGKERVQESLFQERGLVLDKVGGANDKGGTSNDGNQARRFFHADSADAIVGCVAEKYKEDIRKLHKNLSVLLRIVSCTGEIDCDELERLTLETSLLIAEKFKWVEINFTLHGLLHHSLELIEANNGWSIGVLSEEALESNNKFVRRYLERFSRKTSPIQQLTDTMSRLLERSDPEVLHLQRKTKKRVCCNTCGMKHLTDNHKNYLTRKIDIKNSFDELFSKLLL